MHVPSSAGVLVMSPTVKLEVGPPFNSFIHDYIFVRDGVFMYLGHSTNFDWSGHGWTVFFA